MHISYHEENHHNLLLSSLIVTTIITDCKKHKSGFCNIWNMAKTKQGGVGIKICLPCSTAILHDFSEEMKLLHAGLSMRRTGHAESGEGIVEWAVGSGCYATRNRKLIKVCYRQIIQAPEVVMSCLEFSRTHLLAVLIKQRCRCLLNWSHTKHAVFLH